MAAQTLGTSGGGELTVEGLFTISVADLRASHEATLPGYMSDAAAGAAA